jgi:hypothetical protein
LAFGKEQPAAAVQAVMSKAKLHGLIVDKGKMELSGEFTLQALMEAVDGRTRGIPGGG